jgi:hypothetical protein
MQNAKIFMGVFSSIQNAKFFIGCVRAFLLFWALEAKIQNGEWIFFLAKNFARCLVSFCKMIGQNPKFFGWNGELNTPLDFASSQVQ